MVRIGYDAPVLNSPTITGFPDVGTTSADVAPHSRSSVAAAWAPRSMSALCAGSMLTVGISTMWPRRSSKRPRTLWVYESSLRGSGVDPFIGRLLLTWDAREYYRRGGGDYRINGRRRRSARRAAPRAPPSRPGRRPRPPPRPPPPPSRQRPDGVTRAGPPRTRARLSSCPRRWRGP